jgi:outer membrane lipoprotein-sorting protein
MRRLKLIGLLLLLAGPAFGFTESEKADLARVSAYLNTLQSVKARFMQIGPDGSNSEGTVYLRKPGRMRFEYDKPSPLLVVSNGTTIAVENSALKTTDRYPLIDSPLRLLLSDKIDLASDKRVVRLSREPGALTVTARQDSGPARGSIAITFADSGSDLELRQWDVTDAQRAHTIIIVSNLQRSADIPPQLFVLKDVNPFKNTRPD